MDALATKQGSDLADFELAFLKIAFKDAQFGTTTAQQGTQLISCSTGGFGLGATPNAIANMNAMCERYGSAHTAYFVIPLIGAFVVDFLNASILMVFMNLLK